MKIDFQVLDAATGMPIPGRRLFEIYDRSDDAVDRTDHTTLAPRERYTTRSLTSLGPKDPCMAVSSGGNCAYGIVEPVSD
jgi:hypothetical protein